MDFREKVWTFQWSVFLLNNTQYGTAVVKLLFSYGLARATVDSLTRS